MLLLALVSGVGAAATGWNANPGDSIDGSDADQTVIFMAGYGPYQLDLSTADSDVNPPKPVYLDHYAMTPKTPTIRVGEALTWINIQSAPKTDFILVSEDNLWANQSIGYGKKFKYTFNTAGNYTYYCPGYGNAMRGTVTVLEATRGDICVNESGWWRGGGAFNANDTPIQAAVDNADTGETIFVWNGSYTENVDVNKRLTLVGDGADVVTVQAADVWDHVFNVTADYVNISGFTATGATGEWWVYCAGIYLDGANHCNISNNNASNNGMYGGICLRYSSNNLITNNIADSNNVFFGGNGIDLYYSNNNTLTSNIVANNIHLYGISISSSTDNTLTNNTVSNNGCGIGLFSSNNNTLYHNNLINNTHSAYDSGTNTWDRGNEGNHYSDYLTRPIVQSISYDWINTTRDDADWTDSRNDAYSNKIALGFDFVLSGATYTDMQIVSNGVIQLIRKLTHGKSELNSSMAGNQTYWADSYLFETFIFAMCDDLYPDTGWYGYKHYSAGSMDSGGNPIGSYDLVVIDYHVSTYTDGDYSLHPNDFQVVIYANGTLRYNFKNVGYSGYEHTLFTGAYLGESMPPVGVGTVDYDEMVNVVSGEGYTPSTSYIVTSAPPDMYDVNGDGIGDIPYQIPGGSSGDSVDHYPLMELYKYSMINPPIASFTHATYGLTVSFTSTSYDPDGNITTHIWNFGDGKTADAPNPTHTYQIQGDYQVTLVVTDNDGCMASKTETISVGGGVITRVDHPSDLPFGTELAVEVNTDIETDVTLSIGTFLQTKHGTDVVFNVDTTTLGTGEHTLTITAGTESYTDSVIIYDPEVYQTILRGLEDINTCSKNEMHEISGKTGYALANDLYVFIKGMAVDITVDYVSNQLREMLQNMSNTVASELEKFKNILGIDVGYQVDDLDVATILINNTKEYLKTDNALVCDEYNVEWINEHLTKPVVHGVFCEYKANSVDNRTQVAKSNLGVYYTQTELDEINAILSIGKEAIENTDDERIYHFYCAEPTLNYFAEKHEKSLNPSKWCIPWFGCVHDPFWMFDMAYADAQSILTIPAWIGWIEATPDDEEMRPTVVTMFDPITALITAIKMYMDCGEAVEKASPWLIDGGMIFSTDLLAQEVDEEHADIIQAISEITQQSGVEAPQLMDGDLHVPEGNILVTTSPDGKIRNFKYIKSDSILSAPDNNRIISLNTGWSQSFTPESRDISITISSNQDYYNIGDTVNLTVNISSDSYIDGAMVWISIPEEDLTIKDLLDVTGDMSLNYNFTFQNTMLHVPRVYLTDFGVVLAENHTSFDIVSVQSPPGGKEDYAGLISISRDEFYDPGVVSLNVTIYNTDDTPLNPELLYVGSDPSLNGSIDIPTLEVGESTTEQLTFEITQPDRYVIYFILNSSNGALDYNIARFTVTAIDTLLAFPSTDKSIYNTDEDVNIDVTIKNVTLNEVDFPHSLEIIAPSGDIISSASFTPDQNGTYIVKAKPIAEGYCVVEGETMFMVGRQSNLIVKANMHDNITIITVTTDLGGVVENADVVVNGYASKTNEKGDVTFDSFNTSQLIIKAEKFGFNPIVATVNISDETRKGDINHNGAITAADALICLQIAAGSREYDHVADVNDDGQVTSLDALMIVQAAVENTEL